MYSVIVEKWHQIARLTSSVTFVFPVLFLILASFSVLDNLVDLVVRDSLKEMSLTFLKDSEKHAEETFALLSAGKGALAVVGSSSAGISFIVDIQVQLGNIMTPLVDLFDHAWRFTLASLSVIFLAQVLFEILDYLMKPYLIYLGVVWLTYVLCKQYFPQSRYKLKALLKHSAVVFLLLFVTYPLAIAGTALLSQDVTHKHIASLHSDLRKHNALFDSVNKENTSPTPSLKDAAENSISLYKTHKDKIATHVNVMHKTLYTHIAIGLIEIVLLPLLIVFLLHLSVRKLLYANKATNVN